MTYKRTSIEAYHQIAAEGLLSRKRFEVYRIIYQNGPINCREIIEIACRGRVTNTGAISGRLSELCEREVIYEHHTGTCKITGRETIYWAITDNLPKEVKHVKKPTYKELELENAKLKEKVNLMCDNGKDCLCGHYHRLFRG